ncbi:MAG TPA: methyl-accepting chemotaxis protein [Gallionellaceae bacterium]|nr:methyl-accepting chemotaxis protein [Gallionellaceae bacterium]
MAFKLPFKSSGSKTDAGGAPKVAAFRQKGAAKKGLADTVPLPLIGRLSSDTQLKVVGGLAVGALVVALGSAYLDYRTTSFGARYLELAGDLKLLTQRLAKDAGMSVQGDQTAIEALPGDKAAIQQIVNTLMNGRPGIPPLSGAGRSKLSEIMPVIKRNLEGAQAMIDGRPGVQTVLSAVAAVNDLTPIMRQEIPQMATTGGGDPARVARFAMMMERLNHDVANMMSANLQPEMISALGSDVQDADAQLQAFNKSSSAVQKVSDDFSIYRNSVEAIIGQVPQLLAAKAAEKTLFQEASIAAHGAFISATTALGDTISHQLSNRWTTYSAASAVAVLLLALLLLGKIYLDAARHRAFEAETTSRRNQQAILLLMNEMSDLADGDLTVRATVTDDITGAIADSVNYTTDELRKLVSRVTSASDLVADAAGGAQDVSAELLKAAQRQATELRNTSEAVELITRSIREVDTSATQSARVAQRTLEVTEQGAMAVRNAIAGMDTIRDQIQETAKRIKRLGESSQEIGDIVDLISDITEQTNVLALNAAIQAASAGEAGRGFSVVAEEVQRLAERSAEATKQIGALVKTIQGDTQDAVAAMEKSTAGVVEGAKLSDEAGQALREIEQVSHELADLIGSISVSTQVQTDMAQEVAATMAEILRLTERTTEGTKKTADSVTELASLASDLKGSVSGFKL